MLRFLLSASLFLAFTGAASADYVLLKVNLNNLNFKPPEMTRKDKDGKIIEDKTRIDDKKNARWLSVYVESKSRTELPISSKGVKALYWRDVKLAAHEDREGHEFLEMSLPGYPGFDSDAKKSRPTFESEFAKGRADAKEKKKIETYLDLARWTLSRGRLKEFQDVMNEATKIAPNDPCAKYYGIVSKGLAQPFKEIDPLQAKLLADLKEKGFERFTSPEGHFCIYAKQDKRVRDVRPIIDRRLDLMEKSLAIFYYWFALHPSPASQERLHLPRYQISALLTGADIDETQGLKEFHDWHKERGMPPIVGDGFVIRRENLAVLSTQLRLEDSLFQEYVKLLDVNFQDANRYLDGKYGFQIASDKLATTSLTALEQKISAEKRPLFAARMLEELFVAGTAQTAFLVARTLEEEAERYTVTNATMRQLLFASGMFPRNVQVPEWAIEGLSAFFETPPGALYPTIGGPSWRHIVTLRHYIETKKVGKSTLPLVLKDTFFRDANQFIKKAERLRDNAGARALLEEATEARELGRCTSWAYVYFLSKGEKKHLDWFFNLGQELDKLPRDLDVSEAILHAEFAKAFDMKSPGGDGIDNAKLKATSEAWFTMMERAELDIRGLLPKYLEMRFKKGEPSKTP